MHEETLLKRKKRIEEYPGPLLPKKRIGIYPQQHLQKERSEEYPNPLLLKNPESQKTQRTKAAKISTHSTIFVYFISWSYFYEVHFFRV